MSDGERTESADDEDGADTEAPVDGVFSSYGIASTFLAVLSVAAVVLGVLIWRGHRAEVAERSYLSHVMQTATEWTGVLINMNPGNVDASLQRLRDGTVGDLNTDFDAAVQPYRKVVEKLQSQSAGRIEAVAIDSVRAPDTQAGSAGPPKSTVTTKLPPFATRSDAVLLVATSVSENAGAKPQTVHWNLRLEVSDVDGKLMISGLESVR